MSERKSGLLLHISSLPGKFGIGDLGPCAYEFIDFLSATKQSYWQILPVNPTDAISQHSPYSSLSAFAGNILLISPQLLVTNGILCNKDIRLEESFPSENVCYEAVVSYKKKILDLAYERFMTDMSVRRMKEAEFNDFISANAFWLEDYALFVAIKDHFGGKIWTEWREGLRNRESAALRDFAEKNTEAINRVKFFQYLFFNQWAMLRAYGARENVRLIGDLSIYVNLDSADAWQHPQNYKLDDQKQPIAVAGVPPDYFSKTGQRWGNPVYNWEVLKTSGFSWWVARFKFHFKMFDMVRVDHFRGLVQCWEIPASETTAVNGKWADAPVDDLFRVLEKNCSAPLPIIAEDLGYITDDVREAMRRFNLPGMKVLLFAFNGDMNAHPYLPHNYAGRCVVYTGTHDNNTVLGWFTHEASAGEINNVEKYTGKNISFENISWDFIRLAMHSNAELAILPMQDVLGLGDGARMNKPATTDKNWCWRVSKDVFNDALTGQLCHLTLEAKRN